MDVANKNNKNIHNTSNHNDTDCKQQHSIVFTNKTIANFHRSKKKSQKKSLKKNQKRERKQNK